MSGTRIPSPTAGLLAGDGGCTAAALFRRQLFESREDTVRARVDADWRQVAPAHHALGIDDEEGTFRDAVLLTICAVAAGHPSLRLEIGEQGKMDLARLGEGAMAPHAVHGHAKHLRAELLELTRQLAVDGHLVAADRAPVGGVEGQDHGPAAQLRKREA